MRVTKSKRGRGCYGIGMGLNRVSVVSPASWGTLLELWALEFVLGRYVIYLDWDKEVKRG